MMNYWLMMAKGMMMDTHHMIIAPPLLMVMVNMLQRWQMFLVGAVDLLPGGDDSVDCSLLHLLDPLHIIAGSVLSVMIIIALKLMIPVLEGMIIVMMFGFRMMILMI